MINDVLDFSKFNSGQIDLIVEPFDPNALAQEVAETLGPAASAKQIEIAMDVVDSGLDKVKGDAHRIRQVLLNLVHNAIKFSDGGEVAIRVNLDASSLALTYEVTDCGRGIEVEVQKQLFQPFHQGDMSISREHGGTGLGLSISKLLVEAMGGIIGVESEAGTGSRFWFRIPVTTISTSELNHAVQRSQLEEDITIPDFSETNVLLVDDDAINLKILCAMLKRFGIQPEVCSSGDSAVRMAMRKSYDLIFMDIQLPGISGIEAMRRIRASNPSPQPTIVAQTAHAMHGDREQFLSCGADDYLSKPIQLKELRKSLLKHHQRVR